VSLSAKRDVVETSAEPEAAPGERRLQGSRYLLVLLSLITSYLITALLRGRVAAVLSAVLYTTTLLIALRTSRSRRLSRVPRVALLAATAVAVGLAIVGNDIPQGLATVWFGIVLAITIVVVVRTVLEHPVVTMQTIFGALSAYLMIGLMFAAFYAAINHFSGDPFFVGSQPANTNTLQYFSFTTLTTLGYGDFTAAANAGRAIATLEALTGQVFLATLVARLVASFVPRSRPPQ
jgi:hypothetical protein